MFTIKCDLTNKKCSLKPLNRCFFSARQWNTNLIPKPRKCLKSSFMIFAINVTGGTEQVVVEVATDSQVSWMKSQSSISQLFVHYFFILFLSCWQRVPVKCTQCKNYVCSFLYTSIKFTIIIQNEIVTNKHVKESVSEWIIQSNTIHKQNSKLFCRQCIGCRLAQKCTIRLNDHFH